jgi:hypothetical protein
LIEIAGIGLPIGQGLVDLQDGGSAGGVVAGLIDRVAGGQLRLCLEELRLGLSQRLSDSPASGC